MSESAKQVLEMSDNKGERSEENANFDWYFWLDIANELGYSEKDFLKTTVRRLCGILESRTQRRKEQERRN